MQRLIGTLGVMAAGFCLTVSAQSDPFSVSASIDSSKSDGPLLSVSFAIPDKHYLYAHTVKIKPLGQTKLKPFKIPKAKEKYDEIFEKVLGVYAENPTFVYTVASDLSGPIDIEVRYQGCNENLCFLPQTRTISLNLKTRDSDAAPDAAKYAQGPDTKYAPGDWREIADSFTVIGKASGYLKQGPFIDFLDGAETPGGATSSTIGKTFQDRGIWLTVLLIIIGGLALNLTPCVLPMIPVNIAIIGAGAQAGSKKRGFALGATYGAGIALVYGILGVVVILTGARFGTLNSSPWFNIAITILFALLSLSMFGAFNLDLTRFQGSFGSGEAGRNSFLVALIMGGVAALLAGACVAPVVISVLLLSSDLYQDGNQAALILPFLLGLGMALPWPLAGAGLSFLPKPGRWMERVKYSFGVVILAIAVWYGIQSYQLFMNRGKTQSFYTLLTEAGKTGKPIFIDFRADWCKNCLTMEDTTFLDAEVIRRLEDFSEIIFNADNMNDPEVKAVLDYYAVMGLPTYVILER